jgi:hypothetical protein
MKMSKSLLSLMPFALASMVAISGSAVANPVPGNLDQPLGLVCPVGIDAIMADWDDVDGAKKYSVDVTAEYDVDGDDGVTDRTKEFDFGTGDRTDGNPIDQSDLAIPLSDLEATFIDESGAMVTASPVSASLRVKGLNPGKGSGRQNHLFSDPCLAELTI